MFAGAAFTDQADIKVDSDVVDTLVSLGVVEGFENGSFQPNATVTRAQMAKMIYVLRTGNSDASAYNNDKTSFTDINGHWAAGYIKYCQSLGIIAGKSATIFAPNAEVTAQEAAKMLLVTLGYNAEKAGLVGSTWAAKTNALADENGLLDDVNTSFTGPCPRQYAAQLIYNAIDAETVVWRDDAYTNENYAGHLNKTIGEKYMGLYKNTGILKSVKEDSKGTFNVEIAASLASGEASTDYKSSSDYEHVFTKVAKDYTDLLGQEVKVLYKKSDEVFGVYATDKNEVTAVTTIGMIDELKTADKIFEIDGDKVKYNATKMKVVGADGAEWKDASNQGLTIADLLCDADVFNTASTVYFASVNDDDKIDYAVVIPATVAKVTYVGSSSVTLGNGVGTIDKDDLTAYDGIAKDDYVLYTKEADNTVYTDAVEKIEVVTGTVEALKNGNEIKVDGTYYKKGSTVNSSDVPKASDKVKIAVFDGYYYSVDSISGNASADNIVFVYEAGAIKSGVSTGAEASVLFADGTNSTITINKLIDPKTDDEYTVGNSTKITTVKNANLTQAKYANDNTYWATNGPVLVVGAMYTYEKDGAKYNLTPVTADNDEGYDNISEIKQNGLTGEKLDGNRVADDAVIFVAKNLTNNTGADAKVITGKTLVGWDHNSCTSQYATNKSNGVQVVKAAAIVGGTSYGSEDGLYGFVTAKPETVKVNGTTYTKLTVWNGAETTMLAPRSCDLSKGDVFTYEEDGDEDGVLKIKTIDTSKVQEGAMVGTYGTGDIDAEITNGTMVSATGATGNKTYTIDASDTTVLFVDNKTGVVETDIKPYKAIETVIDDLFVANVRYIVDANDNTELDLIVVDIAGSNCTNDELKEISGQTAGTASINGKTGTVVFAAHTDISTDAKALTAMKTVYKNVLGVEKISGNSYTVVATNNTTYTLTLTVAP